MNFIENIRETTDSNYLIHDIISSGWLDETTILINCSPEYSSRLTQLINHKCSYINRNFLFDQLELFLPTKERNQFWDGDLKMFVPFDKYILSWIRNNIFKTNKYLFITNCIFTGKNLNKVRNIIQKDGDIKFATLYHHNESLLKPDFSVGEFSRNPPVFFWENTNV